MSYYDEEPEELEGADKIAQAINDLSGEFATTFAIPELGEVERLLSRIADALEALVAGRCNCGS